MAIVYFISKEGNIFSLGSEDNITVSQSNRSSKSSTMQGRTASDDLEEGNKTLSVSGMVSYTKTARQESNGIPDPITFQRMLDKVISSGERFTVYTNKSGKSLLDNMKDCVVIDRSVTVDRFSNAITATITFEQQFITDAATTTYLPPQKSESVKNLASVDDSGNATKTTQSEEERKTMFAAGFDWLTE
ncbi:hypothetical protein NVP1063O_055 [Vibrio phage 1.063.O._10N.261.45.C7]|nr:hypothetical protein NVP1063O_055 [Vibrio phage 1.063.O._10N.261.45.C7]